MNFNENSDELEKELNMIITNKPIINIKLSLGVNSILIKSSIVSKL